jgi:hypothetical protein
MAIRRFVVSITTASDGTATSYTPYLSGEILQISYVKTDFADGVDFTITSDTTGQTIWTESDVNAAKNCFPRQQVNSTAGVALTLDGTRTATDRIGLGRDRVKIAIAQGGNAKSGAFHVVVKE